MCGPADLGSKTAAWVGRCMLSLGAAPLDGESGSSGRHQCRSRRATVHPKICDRV